MISWKGRGKECSCSNRHVAGRTEENFQNPESWNQCPGYLPGLLNTNHSPPYLLFLLEVSVVVVVVVYLVGATDCSTPTLTENIKHSLRVACGERVNCANALRMGSSNSFTMKSCLCAFVTFLAGDCCCRRRRRREAYISSISHFCRPVDYLTVVLFQQRGACQMHVRICTVSADRPILQGRS
jgi:hypothetical protein